MDKRVLAAGGVAAAAFLLRDSGSGTATTGDSSESVPQEVAALTANLPNTVVENPATVGITGQRFEELDDNQSGALEGSEVPGGLIDG